MKKTFIWIIAILITLFAAIYQRKTGPTYPQKVKLSIDNQEYTLKLLRSHGGDDDATLQFNLPKDCDVFLSFHRYPTNEEWIHTKFENKDGKYTAKLPHQPPAGKLEYFIIIKRNGKEIYNNSQIPVIIRFKGAVPAWVLLPHILFMFLAMLFSTVAGILAIFKEKSQKKFGVITLIILAIGGGILGPLVQKFAFGEYWTGIPFGWDLTDNKTLFALIFWIIAVIGNRKEQKTWLTILASVMLMIIFSIPHSMFGSQLDPQTGEVIQGFIFMFFLRKDINIL